jgi:hypothetical protein
MADKKINAVFIHIPKSGGTYIQNALHLLRLRAPHRALTFENTGSVTFGHLSYSKLLRKGIVSKEYDKSAFKFAFCRNPFDRAVSHYFYTRGKHPVMLPPDVSFLDFTRNLNDDRRLPGRRTIKNSFRPQATWIEGIDIDFIGRFESLNEDLEYVAQEIGIQIDDSPRKNKSVHKPYKEYYNDESEDNIRKHYSDDFKRFGYANNL